MRLVLVGVLACCIGAAVGGMIAMTWASAVTIGLQSLQKAEANR